MLRDGDGAGEVGSDLEVMRDRDGAGGVGWGQIWGYQGMGMVLGVQKDGDGPGDAGGTGLVLGVPRAGAGSGVQEGVSLGVQRDPQQGGLSFLLLQDKPVLCLANQNGSQVECELGNPLKRGAQVGAPPRSPTLTPPSPACPPSLHPSAP